jgi:hypothetical protein
MYRKKDPKEKSFAEKRKKKREIKNGESFVLPFDDASAHAQHHTRSNKRRQTINQNDSVEIKEKKKKTTLGAWFSILCLFFCCASINQLVGYKEYK